MSAIWGGVSGIQGSRCSGPPGSLNPWIPGFPSPVCDVRSLAAHKARKIARKTARRIGSLAAHKARKRVCACARVMEAGGGLRIPKGFCKES